MKISLVSLTAFLAIAQNASCYNSNLQKLGNTPQPGAFRPTPLKPPVTEHLLGLHQRPPPFGVHQSPPPFGMPQGEGMPEGMPPMAPHMNDLPLEFRWSLDQHNSFVSRDVDDESDDYLAPMQGPGDGYWQSKFQSGTFQSPLEQIQNQANFIGEDSDTAPRLELDDLNVAPIQGPGDGYWENLNQGQQTNKRANNKKAQNNDKGGNNIYQMGVDNLGPLGSGAYATYGETPPPRGSRSYMEETLLRHHHHSQQFQRPPQEPLYEYDPIPVTVQPDPFVMEYEQVFQNPQQPMEAYFEPEYHHHPHHPQDPMNHQYHHPEPMNHHYQEYHPHDHNQYDYYGSQDNGGYGNYYDGNGGYYYGPQNGSGDQLMP